MFAACQSEYKIICKLCLLWLHSLIVLKQRKKKRYEINKQKYSQFLWVVMEKEKIEFKSICSIDLI